MLEYALYVSRLKDLKKHFNPKRYRRIYFGSEFCENLIPDVEEVLEVARFASNFGVGFTFITPYVTDRGLEKLRLILEKVYRFECEVVFNDWGFFSVLRKSFNNLEAVMGRLLIKYPRDPRIINYLQKLPLDSVEYYRNTNLTIPIVRKFLEELKVRRVEFDNPLHQVKISFPDFKATLHYPYVYVTTTRLCLGSKDGLRSVSLESCGKTCLKNIFILKNSEIPVALIRRGNTIFYLNQNISRNLEENGFDRLVINPEIPI